MVTWQHAAVEGEDAGEAGEAGEEDEGVGSPGEPVTQPRSGSTRESKGVSVRDQERLHITSITTLAFHNRFSHCKQKNIVPSFID